MTRLLPGDPASLSSCGSAAVRAGAVLSPTARRLEAAYRALGEGWPGRTSVATRRSGERVVAALDGVADELARAGSEVQGYATDLAGLLAAARALEERARSAGLEVRSGRVELGYGLVGEADAVTAAEREAARVRLQAELDALRSRHRRRRDRLVADLTASTRSLAERSAALRS